MLVKEFRVSVDQNAAAWNGGQQPTLGSREVGPRGTSSRDKNNGHMYNGKQHHDCHDGGRQFVQGFEPYLIADAKRAFLERLLVDRLSWRGMWRAGGVTRKGLLGVLVQCGAAFPEHLYVPSLSWQHDVMIRRLEGEAEKWRALSNRSAPAVALARQGRHNAPGDCLARQRSSSQKCHEAVGKDASGLSSARHVLHGSVWGYEGVMPAAQHRAISQVARTTIV